MRCARGLVVPLEEQKGCTMKKITIFGTFLTVPMIALAGAALAADPAPSSDGYGTGTTTGGTMKQMPPDAQMPGKPANPAAHTNMPTNAAVGKDVVNTGGDSIGKVSAISGDQVIVDVGGFLGMGTHGVALNWSDLKPIGSGGTMTLQTLLTKEQIKDLPEAAGTGAQAAARAEDGSSAQTNMPTTAAIGREVVNTRGDNVGEVSAISGNKVIVEVGGFLGIGTHGVALNWTDLKPIGSGETMTLQTLLTKEQIKGLPTYAE